MVPRWATLPLLLSGLLLADGYKLPAFGLLGRDDAVQEGFAGAGLPEDSGSQHGQAQCVWQSKDVGAEAPVLSRKRRADAVLLTTKPLKEFAEDTTEPLKNSFSATRGILHEDETESVSPSALTEEHTALAKHETTFTATPATDTLAEAVDVTEGAHLSTAANETLIFPSETTAVEARTEQASNVSQAGSPWLWKRSFTSSPQPLAKASDVTTGYLLEDLDTSMPGVSAAEKTNSSLPPPTMGAVTTPASPPSANPPSHTGLLVKKCLAVIFILALVAGIFIVCTAVLATMLWRQKRVHQLRRHNTTEMVCISALLPDGEGGAGKGRTPKAKGMKLLTETGSDTEGDNLTLNSLLPDH
uniref:P-selectin glycoprotein ligand 1 n=1 Tax=Sphenodon punctatus TaxID=8508 RepID=A0A8D0L6J0_SPHPU